MWRREAPQEVAELVARLVAEVVRPILGRCWGGGGQEMAVKVGVAYSAIIADLFRCGK